MLKQIVQHSPKFITFMVLLRLSLSKPQTRHVQYIVDAVIVSDAPHKTLRSLYSLIVEAPDPTNAADCLRISPWSGQELREAVRDVVLQDLLATAAAANAAQVIYVSLDDCLVPKDVVRPRNWTDS